MPQEPSHHWYHMCPSCNAKWFDTRQGISCPRCLTFSESTDKRTPPWKLSAELKSMSPAGEAFERIVASLHGSLN
jgi:hypothetical protein